MWRCVDARCETPTSSYEDLRWSSWSDPPRWDAMMLRCCSGPVMRLVRIRYACAALLRPCTQVNLLMMKVTSHTRDSTLPRPLSAPQPGKIVPLQDAQIIRLGNDSFIWFESYSSMQSEEDLSELVAFSRPIIYSNVKPVVIWLPMSDRATEGSGGPRGWVEGFRPPLPKMLHYL